jgi:MFS family permease
MLTGFFMDKFGRKRVIVIKVLLCAIFLIPLVILGFIGNILKQAVLAMFFISIFFATFTFDLMVIGFE